MAIVSFVEQPCGYQSSDRDSSLLLGDAKLERDVSNGWKKSFVLR